MKKTQTAFLIFALLAAALSTPFLKAQTAPLPASRNEILPDLLRNADNTYRTCSTPGKKYGVRELFTSMLAYAESGTNLTRIAELMVKAEAMQERNQEQPRYGNFFWYSTETEVNDANAVDFCMQHAMLLWRFHHDKLDDETQKRLLTIITLGLHGLKTHLPRATYTNIALLNASDLILLGEELHDPAAIVEGNRRLNVCIKTLWEQGVHEYVSSTYYGIDLESMALLKELSNNHSTRETAGTILELLWNDIALNWNLQTEILSGTGSRTYDYLYNRGELDQMMTAAGWLKRPEGENRRYFQYRIFTPLYTEWQPPASLHEICTTRFPRTVEQIFGEESRSYRTHYLCNGITLSTSGCSYGGRMDMPLTVDLPQTRSEFKPRLYFISDGRSDPYGKKRIPEGNHSKALHLNPWWAAVQDKSDALGVVLYNDNTFADITDGLQSHLVFRRALDDLYLDNRKLDIGQLPDHPCTVTTNQSIFLRAADSVIAIRIPWAQGQSGTPASISIIDDSNSYGALRLSVIHPVETLEKNSGLETAGAAFRLRIAERITSDQQFADFREQFIASPAQSFIHESVLTISCNEADKKLSVAEVNLITPAGALVTPQPPTAVLALDGDDIGREILERSPVIQEYLKNKTTLIPVAIAADKATSWPASQGAFTVPIERAEESSKIYLWSPEQEGRSSGSNGKMTWQLQMAESGKYAIEAEILAPTPEDDSFFVSAVNAAGNPVLPEFAWSTGTGAHWRWARVTSRETKTIQQIFELPAGDIKLIFRTREAGIKLSQLQLIPQ